MMTPGPSSPNVEAANWHLTDRCNYRCKFCFMTDLQGAEAASIRGKEVIDNLARIGIRKLNFVGGEPLLHPHLIDFARYAHQCGLTVSIVTNAFYLTQQRISELKPWVDWIGVSIDSSQESTEKDLGRGTGDHVKRVIAASDAVRAAGIKLKVNTVGTKLNFTEDMRPLIKRLRPLRWKVFQMLAISGQNDSYADALAVTDAEFGQFKDMNGDLALGSGFGPTFESSEDMIDSYLMLGPDGSFIRNSDHHYQYTRMESVIRSGVGGVVNVDAFLKRGGRYDW